MKRIIPCILAVIMLIGTFTACSKSGNDVKVTIRDGSFSTIASGTDTMTVDELLKKAGVTVGEKDDVYPDFKKVWRDAGADAIRINRYAKVTVTDGEAKKDVELTGGTVEQAVEQAGFNTKDYTANYSLDAALTDGMVIELKAAASDTASAESTPHQNTGDSNSITGSEEEGFFYVGESGQVDEGYCNGVTVDDVDWIVINGKATKVETESDKTLFEACKAVAACTDSSMSKEEKLRKAFDYIKKNYLEGVRHDPPYKEMDWPIVYANDIFVYGKGDCYSYGAAFAFMGKAIGCSDTYACNSGGHGWAEIEGLVYDPEWDIHHPEYDHFAVDYNNNDTDVNYKRGIEPGADYMHVAV